MLTVRFLKREEISEELNKTISNVYSYLSEKLDFKKVKTLSDTKGIELSSGSEPLPGNKDVTVELIIRKNIVINTSDFNDKAELDRHITKIKHFCEKAKEIEDLKYLPINMR